MISDQADQTAQDKINSICENQQRIFPFFMLFTAFWAYLSCDKGNVLEVAIASISVWQNGEIGMSTLDEEWCWLEKHMFTHSVISKVLMSFSVN